MTGENLRSSSQVSLHTSISAQQNIKSIVAGNIQAIDQALSFLHQLNDAQYTSVQAPYVTSSIGQHMRHIVDVFFAITCRVDPVTIDYDVRRRGAEIETSRIVAIEELHQVRDWMASFEILPDAINQNHPINIRTEVALEDTQSVELPTTIARELVFTSSHAVHHFALISIIAKLQGIELDESFGLAPATATFIRNEAQEEEQSLECAL